MTSKNFLFTSESVTEAKIRNQELLLKLLQQQAWY